MNGSQYWNSASISKIAQKGYDRAILRKINSEHFKALCIAMYDFKSKISRKVLKVEPLLINIQPQLQRLKFVVPSL